MNEESKKKLEDKEWFTDRLIAFWESKGLNAVELKKRTKLTNLNAVKNGVAPQWDKLIKIVHACESDLIEFVEFLIPGEIHKIEGVEIESGRDLAAHKMLATILSCHTNRRRIHGITINLEEFSAAAKREMSEGKPDKSDLKVVDDRAGPRSKRRGRS